MKSFIKINSKYLEKVEELLINNNIEYEEFTSNFYENVCIEEAKVQLENYLLESKLTIKEIEKDLANKIIEQVSDNIYNECDLFDEISEKTKCELENVLNEFSIEKGENIQDIVYENCIIPEGTYIELYSNPFGVNSDVPEGSTWFIYIDNLITYYKFIDKIQKLTECKLKEDEIKIDIYEEDELYEDKKRFIKLSEL